MTDYRTGLFDGYGWVLKEDADRVRAERDRYREALAFIAARDAVVDRDVLDIIRKALDG